MRILFALPGLHLYDRGAEVAFISVARELARSGDEVTLIGSGEVRPEEPYRFLRAPSLRREKFERMPSLPALRVDTAYEELSFLPSFFRQYRPRDYDVTLTCSYPYLNWALRAVPPRGIRPLHVFVTQNGDWPAYSDDSEFRFFGCEGLICTNPEFYHRNAERWRCGLIPNGVDTSQFKPGPAQRQRFGLPDGRPVVLMVSALIESKRVEDGIAAMSRIEGAHLVIAGDGPLRDRIDSMAARLLPDRYTRLAVAPREMPDLYRSADVFLHLSHEEAFGNVYVEALACGLPIVAPDTDRVRWIVGKRETLIQGDDIEPIARSIKRAMMPGLQAERPSRAASFSWQEIGRQYRNFLSELVGSGERFETAS